MRDESGAMVPLTTRRVREMTRALMVSVGEDPSQFGTHSYRIGGATAQQSETVGDIAFSGQVIAGLDPKELRPLLDELLLHVCAFCVSQRLHACESRVHAGA